MGFSSKEDKDNLVLWACKLCGYEWRGKSPRVRAGPPYCSQCGSRSIKVKDWLIDQERWKKTRIDAFERANWQCQACGRKVDHSGRVHHTNYDNYYDINNLVCLCSHCHFLIHGKNPSYIFGKIFLILGIISIILGALGINEIRISQDPVRTATFVLALTGLPVGIALIILAFILTKETIKVRRAVGVRRFCRV